MAIRIALEPTLHPGLASDRGTRTLGHPATSASESFFHALGAEYDSSTKPFL